MATVERAGVPYGPARKPATRVRVEHRLRVSTGLRAGLVDAAALALLPWLYWWRLFAGGRDGATLPAGDFDEYYLPIRAFAARELANGHLPFWNPYLFGGTPAAAEPEHALFYPVHYLLTPFAGADPVVFMRALSAEIPLHLGLAAVGMYLLGRRLWDSRACAWLAAVAFAFGGYALSYPVQQMNVMATWAWLPLALALLHRGVSAGRPASVSLAGLVVGFAVLAGHPHTAVLVVGVALAWSVWLATAARTGRAWLGVGWFAAVVVLVSAVQWLPAAALLPYTVRDSAGYGFGAGGFAPSEFAGLVLSRLPFTAAALYCGVTLLGLAGVGLFAGDPRAGVRFWGWVGVLGVPVSLGGETALHGALYLLVPPLHLFRNPERVALYVSLAVAVLAGTGFRAVLDRDRAGSGRRAGYTAAGVAVGGAGLAVAGTVSAVAWAAAPAEAAAELYLAANRFFAAALFAVAGAGCLLQLARSAPNRRFWAVALVAVVWLDLASAYWPQHVVDRPATAVLPPSPIVYAITADRHRPFRVESQGLLPTDGNAGSMYGFEDLTGNTAFGLATWQRFVRDVPAEQRWSLLGVRYVVTREPRPEPWLDLRVQDGDLRLYRVRDDRRQPRAHLATAVVEAPTADDVWAAMRDASPSAVVMVAGDVPPPTEGAATSPVRYHRLDTDRIHLSVTTPVSGMVALGDVWAPGWRATSTESGRQYPVLLSNGALMAIPVGPGAHEIELRYEPPGFNVGLALSLGGLAAVAGVLSARLWSARPRPRVPDPRSAADLPTSRTG